MTIWMDLNRLSGLRFNRVCEFISPVKSPVLSYGPDRGKPLLECVFDGVVIPFENTVFTVFHRNMISFISNY